MQTASAKRPASGVAKVHRLEHVWPCRLDHAIKHDHQIGCIQTGGRSADGGMLSMPPYGWLDVSLQEKIKPPLRKDNNISWWNTSEAWRIMKLCIFSLPAQGKSLTLWALEAVEISRAALNLKVTLSSTGRSFCWSQNVACMHFLNNDKMKAWIFHLCLDDCMFERTQVDFIPL